MRGVRSVGAVAAAVVVLLAGCGSSKSSSASSAPSTGASTPASTPATTPVADPTQAFKTGISPVLAQFKAISGRIGTTIQQASGQTDVQLASAFTDLAGQWQTQVAQLQTLKPPAAVAAPYTQLAGAAASVEADLKSVAAAAQAHGAAEAKTATTNLVKDILKAKAAAEIITTKLGTT